MDYPGNIDSLSSRVRAYGCDSVDTVDFQEGNLNGFIQCRVQCNRENHEISPPGLFSFFFGASVQNTIQPHKEHGTGNGGSHNITDRFG